MYDINKGDHFPQFCDLQVLEDKYGGGGESNYRILPCIMHTFFTQIWGENKDAHYTWIVLIPYLYKCF